MERDKDSTRTRAQTWTRAQAQAQAQAQATAQAQARTLARRELRDKNRARKSVGETPPELQGSPERLFGLSKRAQRVRDGPLRPTTDLNSSMEECVCPATISHQIAC